MASYGQASFDATGLGIQQFGDMLQIAKWANKLYPKVTAASFTKAISSFKGVSPLNPSRVNCAAKRTTSACGDAAEGATIKGGKWKTVGVFHLPAS